MKTEIIIAIIACCWCAFDAALEFINPFNPPWRRLLNLPAPFLFFYAAFKLLERL
jgi:hypothetical protein